MKTTKTTFMKKAFLFSSVSLLLMSSTAFKEKSECTVDYKNLSSGDIRALDQKIKTCGCPTTVYAIKEYAVLTPEKAEKVLSISAKDGIKSVVAVRSGWAYDFSDCKRGRYWSDTGSNGKVYEQSTSSVENWIGKSIGGITVEDNFGTEW